MYQDFDRLRQKHGIEEWRAKFVERKYAFEEPGVQKGESEWMKVVYGFDGEHSPDHLRTALTSCRARDTDGHHRFDVQPYLWYQHYAVRATSRQAKDYGPVLARDQGSHVEHKICK